MNTELKQVLLDAINFSRPTNVEKDFFLPIWNQPFFYHIDKASVLTVGYNPTDRGARVNYPTIVEKYKKNGSIPANEIFDLLYDFKVEPHWRKNYDLLFNVIGFNSNQIAHMDYSSFPYSSFKNYQLYKSYDASCRFLFKTIDLLKDQLKIVFIDGAKNKKLIDEFNNFSLLYKTALPINGRNKNYDLLIYKHESKKQFLIYYGCAIWGQTCPQTECIINIGNIIKEHIKAYLN